MKEFYKGDRALYEIVTGTFWPVEVVEVRRAYGKVRYTIVPVGGGDKVVTEKLKSYQAQKK